MPVELEGYIRPGCTILTAFIAMPKLMWIKLAEDSPSHILNLVASGGMLSGKGALFVNLNNKVLQVGSDGARCAEVEKQALLPIIHFVYPICFEAGQCMEFVACASNLSHTNFRFLISFAGQYVACRSCEALSPGEKGSNRNTNHQFFKVCVTETEPDLVGPAFIEVENERGLSNFLPVIIGDGEVCSELKRIHLLPNLDANQQSCASAKAGFSAVSEFLTDVAWLIRRSDSDKIQHPSPGSFTSDIDRCACLLAYLLSNEHFVILEKVLKYLDLLVANNGYSPDRVLDLMRKARDILRNRKPGRDLFLDINRETLRDGSHSCSFPSRKLSYRPLAVMVATSVICLGMCAILFHPLDVSSLTVTIRRCLFDGY